MKSLKLEIVGTFPPVYLPFCKKCLLLNKVVSSFNTSKETLEVMPPNLLEMHVRLFDFLNILYSRFGSNLQVQLIDALSLKGAWKTFRHRIRKNPAFIVNGKKVFQGFQEIDKLLQELESEVTRCAM